MPSASGRLLADERGQSLAFVLTTLLALMLIVAVGINVGQAMTRRMLLQMLADAGAFTGATVMAQGMNTIADQNLRIQRAWALTSEATLAFTTPPCIASDLAVSAYGTVQRTVSELIRRVNSGYGELAAAEAREVTRYNAIDLFPGERLTMREFDFESGIVPQRPGGRLVDLEEVPSGTAPAVSSPTPGFSTKTWSCLQGPAVLPRSASFGLWFQNASSDPIQFVWVVKAPRTRARFFDQLFGSFSIPEMTAAAVAKPIGGDIRRGRTDYVAKMTALRKVTGQVFDAVFRKIRPVHH